MIVNIIKQANRLPIYKRVNWKILWEEKLDYYEYQMSELGLKYKKLRESFSYYSGLCECAISLLNYVSGNVCMYTTSVRGKTIDSITRDIAEYIKFEYFSNNNEILIDGLYLSSEEYILLMARLLYPSYYFDAYDYIIQGKMVEEEVSKIIKKSSSFELLLKKIYLFIKQRSNIPDIEWLYSNNF